MLHAVLAAYGFPPGTEIVPHGSGLINRTWTLRNSQGRFILQQVNQHVFTDPALVARNIDLVGDYLAVTRPDILFPRQRRALDGKTLVVPGPDRFFRVFPFVEGSRTIDVVAHPAEAREAARQFGRFARVLSGFPAEKLAETLPRFHDLSLRYEQFRRATREGDPERLKETGELAAYLESQRFLVDEYERIVRDPSVVKRVTHHDTKISNILFDSEGRGLCVIDLDTVMPGYFISDLGDMFRTYLSPVSEEENDLSLIGIREIFFEAIMEGYLSEMQSELSAAEKKILVYAGSFLIYMQALRFLTDYLLGDCYYGQKYEGHNYRRALNQATLLKLYHDKTDRLQEIATRISDHICAQHS